jgi:hypothetical protein
MWNEPFAFVGRFASRRGFNASFLAQKALTH